MTRTKTKAIRDDQVMVAWQGGSDAAQAQDVGGREPTGAGSRLPNTPSAGATSLSKSSSESAARDLSTETGFWSPIQDLHPPYSSW